jgi:hypothetical protein
MATVQVTYDIRSGRIMSLHHGPVGPEHARRRAHEHSKPGVENIGVITVPSNAFGRGKRFKVDVARKTLVESPEGAGFAFGVIGTAGRSV